MMIGLQILLVGEQPVPNLLALRFVKAEQNVLLHTARTQRQAENLRRLAACEMALRAILSSPYNPLQVRDDVLAVGAESCVTSVAVNVTGGTKLMALGAFLAAQARNWPCLYLESEAGSSLLRRFELQAGVAEEFEVPSLCTIDDYLRIHGIWAFAERGPKNDFERSILAVAERTMDEVKAGVDIGGQMELDLICRLGNNFGVAEIKSGRRAEGKEAIDQLSTATAREYFGAYTRRVLILDRAGHHNSRLLAEARGIHILELPSARSGALSDEDSARAAAELHRLLTPSGHGVPV